ncbi:MAG: hypothetical protein IRZ16_08920 [Myxococcaceae bacterium]|nr:hypothetical protein [Myxococcaceae bacterium]
MGDTFARGLRAALFAGLCGVASGCAHDRPPPAPRAIGGAGQAGQAQDVDDAATEPRTDQPGEDEAPLPPPRAPLPEGTGGSGPIRPPPPRSGTTEPAPLAPRTRSQLEGDRAPATSGNSEQVGPVGDQKQE